MSRRHAILALILLLPAPSVGTLLGFWIAPGTTGQIGYAVCKLWIFALPVIWIVGIERQSLDLSAFTLDRLRAGSRTGICLGTALASVIVLAWASLGRHWLDPDHVRQLLGAAGFMSPQRYLIFGVFLVLVNSLLEEMVWRWFVFTRFRALVGERAGVGATAFFFTLHHILMLGLLVDPAPAALGSVGIFAAGYAWSTIYARYDSIWPCYCSHVMAILAPVTIGWFLLFPAS